MIRLPMRASGVISIALLLLALIAPTNAYAWKAGTHVHLADQALQDALSDGKVTFYCVDHESGSITGEVGEYSVDPAILEALRSSPDQFRAGAIGPDAYPDILTGAQVIHINSNAWLEHLWEASRSGPWSSPQVRAFVVGFLAHGAGDLFGHSYINYYTGGPFSIGPNAAKHIAFEGYIERRTPSPLYSASIAGVESFIYEEMVNAAGDPAVAGLLAGAGSQFSIPRQFSDLRASVRERELTTSIPLLPTFYKRWVEDIDAGLMALPSYSHGVGMLLMFNPAGMDEEKATKLLEQYYTNHLVLMMGGPRSYPQYSQYVDSLTEAFVPERMKAWWKGMKEGAMNTLVKYWTGYSLQDIKEMTVKDPQFTFGRFGSTLNLAEVNRKDLQIEDTGNAPGEKFSYWNFPAAYNTVTMCKLLLLSQSEVNRLLRDLDSTASLDRQNIMLGFLRSMDDSEQWEAGGKMAIARDPRTFRLLFMKQKGMSGMQDDCRLSSLKMEPSEVKGGEAAKATVEMSRNAPKCCMIPVKITSSKPELAWVSDGARSEPGSKTMTVRLATSRVKEKTTVEVSAEYGKDRKTSTLTLLPLPEPLTCAISGPAEGEVGESLSFTATTGGGVRPHTVKWTADNGAEGTGTGLTTSFDSPGTFGVTALATDSAEPGSLTWAVHTVTIRKKKEEPVEPGTTPGTDMPPGAETGEDFKVAIAGPVKVEVGEPVEYAASVTGGTPAYRYWWETGKITSRNPAINGKFSEATVRTIRLTAFDSGSYKTGGKTASLTVNVFPRLKAEIVGPRHAEVGSPVKFTHAISGGSPRYRIEWETPKGRFSKPAIEGKPSKAGKLPITLRVWDQGRYLHEPKVVAMTLEAVDPLKIAVKAPAAAKVNEKFAMSATAEGGLKPYGRIRWTVEGGKSAEGKWSVNAQFGKPCKAVITVEVWDSGLYASRPKTERVTVEVKDKPSRPGGLSDVRVEERQVSIGLRDHGQQDGDIITLYLNGKAVVKGMRLTSRGWSKKIKLAKGKNTLSIYAHNEGTESPNTAELSISGVEVGQSVQQYRLKSGQTATMVITAP